MEPWVTSATSNGCGGSRGRGLRAIAKASENSSKELRNPFGFRRENLGAWLGWVNSDADSNTHDRLTAVAGSILASDWIALPTEIFSSRDVRGQEGALVARNCTATVRLLSVLLSVS
jgi:hypothetical protein